MRCLHHLAAQVLLAAVALSLARSAWAQSASENEPERYSLHAQSTVVVQYHPAFRSAYRGKNSLDPGSRGNETVDLTLFAGARLWRQGEVYINGEVDQGFGLSGTFGVAGFPSGEAYKVGASEPYARLPRLFFRQSFDLRGEEENLAPGANQLGGSRSSDNVIVTLGKFSVTDIFDTNTYAHDPRADFLNWAVIDAGAFDYAADAWAYTYGAAAEWTQSWWTLRAGVFDLSRVPNSKYLQRDFEQFEAVAEVEARASLGDLPNRIKLLGYFNRGRMANYSDALRAAAGTGLPPDVAAVRNYATRPGMALNLEQKLGEDWGAFLRLSANDGSKETYEFTEIHKSASLGVSITGTSWNRANDTLGFAGVVNGISHVAQEYFAAGGLGILIGDGRLSHYATEDIFETYYNFTFTDWLTMGIDYQFIAHPAYNADRGPVSALAFRAHVQI